MRQGLVEPDTSWVELVGGRTNQLWKLGTGPEALVCKLYNKAAASYLFPNDPDVEWQALQFLSGTGIAPDPVTKIETEDGPCLVYRFVEGASALMDVKALGSQLRRLHERRLPNSVRKVEMGAEALRTQTLEILLGCHSKLSVRLAQAEIPVPNLSPVAPVFLHGDFVPANAVVTVQGATFIDWQCPGNGDPCEDLAMFLSPAMQALYGDGPLSQDAQARFLGGYGKPDLEDRLTALRPFFHWRMAAHCLWKVGQGDTAYEKGLALELAALEKLSDPNGKQRDTSPGSHEGQIF